MFIKNVLIDLLVSNKNILKPIFGVRVKWVTLMYVTKCEN